MESYSHILSKLQGFLNRYYTRQLLQGVFLFVFLGGLLLLLMASLEYFLWMGPGLRTLAFWLLIALEALLLVRYILFPVLRMARLKKGLSPKEGSRIIGAHFPEVSDRLLNLLDLAEQPEKTELLMASIEQRSARLKRIPFARAVSMKAALSYAKYALIPVALVVLLLVAGKAKDIYESYQRVVHYTVDFEQPAPYRIEITNSSLRIPENEPFTLKVRTRGAVSPETMTLVVEGKPLIMEDALTHYEYTFRPPLESLDFYLESNEVRSRQYTLEVIPVPVIDQFKVSLKFPTYLGRPDQAISGTGNMVIPEGTDVRWDIRAIHTEAVRYMDKDTVILAEGKNGIFDLGYRAYRSVDYQISTSNADISEYDVMKYHIEIVADEAPEIEVEIMRDSLNPNLAYFNGALSDDYGLSGLRVGVHPTENPKAVKYLKLPVPADVFHTFYYTFPSGMDLKPGEDYTVYFEAKDNDGLRGGKTTKSRRFQIRILDAEEMETQKLGYQKSLLRNFGNSQKEREALQEELEEFNEQQREKDNLQYNDQQRLEEVLKRQVKQERLMQKFSKELSENLEETSEENPFKELLQERLERQEIEARKNEALMEEMRKVLDKLDKEELQERMDQMGKRQASNKRSLEQLLELTKRYYVEQQSAALSRKLEKLAERQEVLSKINDNTEGLGQQQQEKINKEFDSVRTELGQLEKDNQALRKPLPWKRDVPKEEAAKEDQEEALDILEKTRGEEQAQGEQDQQATENVEKRQKAAARKIRELSEDLRSESGSGGSSQTAEDAEMLRQILDNLVAFSFEQESLFERIQDRGSDNLHNGGDIRRQQELKILFEHVDDSLFALSLRRPEISEEVNTQIEEVYYNIDKGLESLSENQWFRGASYQQYVITAGNEMAAMLANNLDNMVESMRPGSGQGGGDQQLPDIIQSQEELRQQMQEGSGKGQQQGETGQEGQQGSSGEQGGEGSSGSENGEGQGSGKGEGQGEGGSGNGSEGEGEGSGKGEGEGKGKNGQGEDGSGGGTGANELSYEEVYEIYKEQQRIRQELEQQLEDMIQEGDQDLAKRIVKEMEQFESELLRNGITQRTAERLNRIQQQLMRLENAAMQQGREQERESTTNEDRFRNPVTSKPELFENEGIDTEILNKQVLPLRRIYKEKVKSYFRENDQIPL